MVYRDSSILEYNTDRIIEFLDDHFDTLNNLEVVVFTYHYDKKFMMKIAEKLLECGCNVTLCNYTENEISLSYPHTGAIILDITGKSLSEMFMEIAETNPVYSVYTSKTKD